MTPIRPPRVVRRRGLLVLLLAVCAACVPIRSSVAAPAGVHSDPVRHDYEAFRGEFCRPRNYGDHTGRVLFYARALSLAGSLAVTDFPFRVLSDRRLAPCWRNVTELIALAGSPREVERLLDRAEGVRLGRSRPKMTVSDAFAAANFESKLWMQMGVASVRLGEAHPVSRRMVEAMGQRIRSADWRRAGHLPQCCVGESKLSPAEVEDGLAELMALRCIDGLGDTGSTYAAKHLQDYLSDVEGRFGWEDTRVVEFSLRSSLETLGLLRRMGLGAFMREHAIRL